MANSRSATTALHGSLVAGLAGLFVALLQPPWLQLPGAAGSFVTTSSQKFDGTHCLRNENSTLREPCGPGVERCSADWPDGYAPKYHVMDPSCLMNGERASQARTHTRMTL